MTQQSKPAVTSQSILQAPNVKAKIEELLGKRASAFISSVLQVVNSNNLLKNAEPMSVYQSAMMAAVLDLPLNNSLGFAYIVPYNTKQPDGTYKPVAQFQIGYKGFIQLAQRSGQFKTIGVSQVLTSQIIKADPLMGYEFDFNKKDGEVAGYAARFELLNGFGKTMYMSVDELKAHGLKYSKTFDFASGLWKQNFDAMASKTVLKLLLSKYAPLSIEMQKAVTADQSVIKNAETMDVNHVDVTIPQVSDEDAEIISLIKSCATKDQLEAIAQSVPEHLNEVYFARVKEVEKLADKKNKLGKGKSGEQSEIPMA